MRPVCVVFVGFIPCYSKGVVMVYGLVDGFFTETTRCILVNLRKEISTGGLILWSTAGCICTIQLKLFFGSHCYLVQTDSLPSNGTIIINKLLLLLVQNMSWMTDIRPKPSPQPSVYDVEMHPRRWWGSGSLVALAGTMLESRCK